MYKTGDKVWYRNEVWEVQKWENTINDHYVLFSENPDKPLTVLHVDFEIGNEQFEKIC